MLQGMEASRWLTVGAPDGGGGAARDAETDEEDDDERDCGAGGGACKEFQKNVIKAHVRKYGTDCGWGRGYESSGWGLSGNEVGYFA